MNEKNPNSFLNLAAALFLIGFSFFILKELQSIIIPFFIAILVAFVFFPFYDFMKSKKIPAGIAIVIVVITILILSNIISVLIVTSINSFTAEFPKYEAKVLKIFESITEQLNLSKEEIERFNSSMDIKNLLMDGKLTSAITGVFSGITGIMGNYILIIFYVIFILSEARSIQERITFAFSEEKQEKMSKTIVNIFEDVKGYLFGKTMLSLSQAIVIGIILWAFGVDFYFIWAFLFFITDFIPNVGSLLSSVLVTITMLLQFDNIVTPIIILVILILIQNIKGNIIEPKIFGARLNLSPLLLFLSLVFWGYIWGIVGMMLSVPIMSMIKIVLMNFPQTRPIGILMSYNLTSINKN